MSTTNLICMSGLVQNTKLCRINENELYGHLSMSKPQAKITDGLQGLLRLPRYRGNSRSKFQQIKAFSHA